MYYVCTCMYVCMYCMYVLSSQALFSMMLFQENVGATLVTWLYTRA